MRPAAMAAWRGGALVRGGGDGWAQKLHGDDGVPFPGSARGVDGWSRELHGEAGERRRNGSPVTVY